MSSPLVSIIMPVYNCEEYIVQALNSVIHQTYKNIEIIVVDDHSTDNTWKILQAYAKKDKRIKHYRNEENLKIVKTLNKAVIKSKGEYLARMDGDDERILDSIECQVDFLERNKDVVIVGGTVEICDDNMNTINQRTYEKTDKQIRAKIFRFSPFTHASIMMRANMVPNNPYKLDWAEDYDLYFRLGMFGKFANLEKVIYRIRTHRASVSQTKTRYQEKLTLFIRLKAIFEYGYKMKTNDKWYFFFQFLTMYLMPPRFRFWLFNKVRKVL